MQKKNKLHQKQQRVILPIILWLIPLLALNFGFVFLAEIDLHWREIEQSDFANQEVEGVAAASDFSYQFSNICGSFGQSIKAGLEAEFPEKGLESYLQSRARKIFRKPFPEKDIFVFQIPENGEMSKILLHDGSPIMSKRAFIRIFEYLVALNHLDPIPDYVRRQNEKLLTNLLGGESRGSYMAISQKAVTSYAIYNNGPHWFYWDYFKIKGKGTFGYIILSKCTDQNRFDGMLLSLRNFRDRRIGLAAFIPLFKGYGSSVLTAPLHKSRLFKTWAREKIPSVENNLKHWLASGTPPVADLGNFRVFSYLGKGNTHLTTILLPKLKEMKIPPWLRFLNLLVISVIIVLLLRGFLQNHWPKIKLKLRFQITFLLAATLPLSLLFIASSGYISQYRRSINFQTASNLLMSLKLFDSRKAQIEEEYISAFKNLIANPEFKKALKTGGSKSLEAEKILQENFQKRKTSLPLMCYAILDEKAEGIKETPRQDKEQMNLFIDSFSYPIVNFLCRQINKSQPENPVEEYDPPGVHKMAAEAYQSVASLDLIEEIGRRRSYPINRTRTEGMATQMHDYIEFDGVERYAVLVAWEGSDLDNQTLKQTKDFLALNRRDFSFIRFRTSASGIEPDPLPDRHVDFATVTAAKKLAEAANFKGSYASIQTKNATLVAYPSEKYANSIIVGISNNSDLQARIFYRVLILSCILALAIIVVVLVAYLCAKVTLEPITNLKISLDHISSGDLDVDIKVDSNDELGILATEFSSMAKGLRERNRLASLLSDQAIEALSKNQAMDGILSGESFSGVALVSDIRNFTGMCEEYPADQITELLNEHFARMAAIISKSGGRIYKFIGDAIEAVFPEDSSFEEKPESRAFKAAAAMNIEQLKINRQRLKNKKFSYSSGIGLAWGKFYSGGTGSLETRLDYAVLGDALKRAAELESCSKKNPAFPVVVDKKIADSLKGDGIFLAQLDDIESYTILEISNLQTQDILQEEYSQEENKDDLPSITIESSDKVFNQSLFTALGVLLIAMILAGVFFGLSFRNHNLEEIERVNISQVNLRLIEQMKGRNAAKTGFENLCYKSVGEIEKQLAFNRSENELSDLKGLVESQLSKLASESLKIERVAAFNFVEKTPMTSPEQSVKKVINSGWSEDQTEILQKFAFFKNSVDHDLQMLELHDILEKEIPKVFGEAIELSYLYIEKFATAFPAIIDGKEEFVFVNYLFARHPSVLTRDLSAKPSSLSSPGQSEIDFRIVGMIFFTIAENSKNLDTQLFLNSYAEKNISLALQNETTGSYTFSLNFPEKFKADFVSGNYARIQEQAVVTQDLIFHNNDHYNLAVLSEYGSSCVPNSVGLALLIPTGLFLLWLLFRLASGSTFINYSLPMKLWAAFFVCALIPVTTMFFVVDLFSIENFNSKVSQEKADLQRFLDLFEHRQTFSEPLAWKTIKNFSYSQELRDAIEEVDRQDPARRDFAPLEKIFSDFSDRIDELKKTVANFDPRDAVIVSKTGWDFANHGNRLKHLNSQLEAIKVEEEKNNAEPKKENQFSYVLIKVGKNLISRMRKEAQNQNVDAAKLEAEIAVKKGLQVVSSMFGENVGIKVANGVGLPVKMEIIDSVAGLIIHPVEQILMPDYIVIWMILFHNTGYLSQIASLFSGDRAIFSISSGSYGYAASPFKHLVDFGLIKLSSWVVSSNRPISIFKEINNQEFMIESRRGIQQPSMILTGVKPIKPIRNSVQKTKYGFLQLLLLSMLLIALMAKNVSAEIIEPIQLLTQGMKEISKENFSYRIDISRGDELGDLCDSFDHMARGLEEKLLIGKMLSKTAMDSTLQETSSKKEELVVFYIGSPGFSSWLGLSSPSELFSDLQKQVSEIARIILAEGGEIDKIIGEKILAIFKGDPLQASISACRVGLRILQEEQKGELPFPVAGGINKGLVISGILGVGNKKDFTIIGDTVNVAARIEALAETMRYHRVLVSEEIFKAVEKSVPAREYGKVELKGKSAAVRVFQLEA